MVDGWVGVGTGAGRWVGVGRVLGGVGWEPMEERRDGESDKRIWIREKRE